MIRKYFLTIAVICMSTISLYAEEKKIEIIQAEKSCYLCGRTEKDFKYIHQAVLKQIDNQINETENEIKKIQSENKARYKRISKSTRNNQNIVLTVDTVKTDLSTFRKSIPELDKILDFYEKYKRNMNLGSSSKIRLSEIVKAMNSSIFPEIKELEESLGWLKEKRKAYSEVEDNALKFRIYKASFKFEDYFPKLKQAKKANSGNLAFKLSKESKNRMKKGSRYNTTLLEEMERFKKEIENNNRIHESKKNYAFSQYKVFLFDFDRIHHEIYLCPIFVNLLEKAHSIKYMQLKY